MFILVRAARRALSVGVTLSLVCGAASAQAADSPLETRSRIDPVTRNAGSAQWQAVGASVGFKFNDQLGAAAGIASFDLVGRKQRLGEYTNLPLRADAHVTFSASPGRVESFDDGYFQIEGALKLGSGERSTALAGLRVMPDATDPMRWRVVDAKNQVWFDVRHGMYNLAAADRLNFPTMDLYVGAALAKWTGRADSAGALIGEMRLESTVLAGVGGLPQPKSCSSPNWPNVGNFRADVLMENISLSMMRCRKAVGSGGCDGTNTADDGEVVFAPNSTLRNSDLATTADIPWYTKFQGNFPPYNNDQHPFLIWNMYRVDADGKLEQIARSGVKHAFVSVNVGCAPESGCSFGNILGRRCGDTYATSNNDTASALGPRNEIIPAKGKWGRCGSIYDDTDNNSGDGLAGCDGQEDGQSNGSYGQRLIARESQLTTPGASYYFDSWYIVRDDIDIYNTQGYLKVTPSFQGSTWSLPQASGGAFKTGVVIDQWVSPASVSPNEKNVELANSEGHAKIAVKVTDLGGGNYRYDYAVHNFDFAREVTENAEPNLRVIRANGFDAFSIPLPAGVVPSSIEFGDGDLDAANNWTSSVAGNAITWTCPLSGTPTPQSRCAGNPLNWGTLFRFGFVAAAAPVAVDASLTVAEAGTPAAYTVSSLGPDGEPPVLPDDLFKSGYEDGE